MLRISEESRADGGTALVLEGRLVGPWVDELRRITSVRASDGQGGRAVVDLRGVEFADREGLAFLRGLRSAGVRLVGSSDFLDAMMDPGEDDESNAE